jgi:serine/threonine-protein kinase
MSSPSAPRPSDAAVPRPGEVVAGKYRIEERLGAGGMGVVLRATHLQLGEPVAIKLLHGEMLHDVDQVRRFLREAPATVRIKSEHVARVLDAGTLRGGEPFMVMELLVGEDLQRLCRRRGPLPFEEAAAYVLQACSAIAEAHQLGIVHRDLKPPNLFLTHRADGSPLVKVLDFGIAKTMGATDQSLTATGVAVGSPHYMSPEQIRDARLVDGRSDIWSLGCILYALLSGHPPFVGTTASGTLAKIVADPVPPLRDERPDLPAELEAIILACLTKSREQRFQRAEDLADALATFLQRARASSYAGEAAPAAAAAAVHAPLVTGDVSLVSVSGPVTMDGTTAMPGIFPTTTGMRVGLADGPGAVTGSGAGRSPSGATGALTPPPMDAGSGSIALPAETTATNTSVTGLSRAPRSPLVPAALGALAALVIAGGLVIAFVARSPRAPDGVAAPAAGSGSAPAPAAPPPASASAPRPAAEPSPPSSSPDRSAQAAPAAPPSATRPAPRAPGGRDPRRAPPPRGVSTVPIYGQD